jgi:hypothetical protein
MLFDKDSRPLISLPDRFRDSEFVQTGLSDSKRSFKTDPVALRDNNRVL